MKRLVVLMVTFIVVMSSVSSMAEKVKLRHLAHVATQSELEIYRGLAESFESKNPGIEVEIVAPSGAWLDNLIVMVAGGTPPDTIFTPSWWIPQLVRSGLLLDLESFASKDPTWSDEVFFPVTIEQTFYKGGRYAVPRHFSPMLTYYNRDAYRESGLSDPSSTWTWEQFRANAIRLTRSTGDKIERWGFNNLRNWDLRSNALLIPIVQSFGGDIFSADGMSLELASPVSSAAVQWVMDLTLKDNVAPTKSMNFTDPKIAMTLNIFSQILSLRTVNVAFDWDLAQVPTGVNGRVNRAATGAHSVVRQTNHPQEAWEWVKFLTSKEAQETFSASGLVMGARRDAAIVKTLIQDNVPPKNLRLFLEAPLDARPYPMTPNYNDAVAAILPALDAGWKAEKPFSVLVKEIKDSVEAILRK